jgi:acyl carrier protein
MTSKSQKVLEIIADSIEIDTNSIDLNKSFADLGADSLTTIEIIVALEAEFDLEVPEDLNLDSPIQSILDYVENN